MKLFRRTFITTIVLISFSCEKDFLETFPTEIISADQISIASQTNPELQSATVAGIYENFFKSASGGTERHTDYGIKGVDVMSDMLSGDMVLGGKNYGWYRNFSELTVGEDFTQSENYIPWTYFYRIINLSNIVIDGLGGNDSTPELEAGRHYLGQAKATRAWAYFYLIHLYVNDISNLTQEVLPLYVDTASPNQPKSSLQVIFDQIILDLTSAETLLSDYDRSAKNEINADIVNGLLAYTYGALNRFQEMQQAAAKVIASGYPVMTADEVAFLGEGDQLGGFWNIASHPGIIWGTDLTPDNEVNLISFWGHVDFFSYSYAGVGDPKTIDEGLRSQMRNTDVRLNQFDSQNRPTGKFYHRDRIQFGGPNSGVDSDIHYMRIAEMYLLHAEASAELGEDVVARNSLKSLLDLRMDDTSYIDVLTGQALKNEIYLQTRLELWGEGKSYLAMKRKRTTITRGSNWIDFPGQSFSHNNEKLTLEIPEDEILFNPEISTQN